MRFGKTLTAAVLAVSVAGTPALAQASSAVAQSARASASLEDESNLGGGFIIPLIAIAAVIAGIIIIADGGDDAPTSP